MGGRSTPRPADPSTVYACWAHAQTAPAPQPYAYPALFSSTPCIRMHAQSHTHTYTYLPFFCAARRPLSRVLRHANVSAIATRPQRPAERVRCSSVCQCVQLTHRSPPNPVRPSKGPPLSPSRPRTKRTRSHEQEGCAGLRGHMARPPHSSSSRNAWPSKSNGTLG